MWYCEENTKYASIAKKTLAEEVNMSSHNLTYKKIKVTVKTFNLLVNVYRIYSIKCNNTVYFEDDEENPKHIHIWEMEEIFKKVKNC